MLVRQHVAGAIHQRFLTLVRECPDGRKATPGSVVRKGGFSWQTKTFASVLSVQVGTSATVISLAFARSKGWRSLGWSTAASSRVNVWQTNSTFPGCTTPGKN